MSTKLVNKATGQSEIIDDNDVDAALASNKYVTPDAVAVHRFGEDTYATPDVAEQESAITPTIDPGQTALAQGHAIREARNTGVIATAKAALGGAVSGITMGMANPFAEAQEFNPLASGIGQLGGALAPGLVGDEGGLLGLATDPLEAERATSTLSSNMLFGGEAASDVDKGVAGAKDALDTATKVPEDLAALDAKGLRDARDAEIGRLQADQMAQRSAAVQDLTNYRDAVTDANPWLVVEGQDASRLRKSANTLRNAMDDSEGLAKNPGSLLKPLRIQAKALQGALDNQEELLAGFKATNAKLADSLDEELQTLPDNADSVDLSGKLARRYGAYADVKVGKGAAATVSVARDDAAAFLEALRSGKVEGDGAAALNKVPGLLDANKALQAKIEASLIAKGDLTSSRLSQIADAQDALTSGRAKPTSLPAQMLQGTVFHKVAGVLDGTPFAPLSSAIGAKASQLASDLVFGRLGNATKAVAEGTAAAAGKFLEVAKRAVPTLPVLATKTLAKVRFAPKGTAPEPSDGSLESLYNARSAEIRSQTMYDDNGNPVMRPEARAQVTERLAPIAAAHPMLADQMETIAARRLEFLSSKLPRRPDAFGIASGPDRWHPSELEMRAFARYVAAAEDPAGVEERLATGQVTPEDAEAYRAVYPERFAALQAALMSALPNLQRQLPYKRRLALSIFTGVPVDPAMHPVVLGILQSHFQNEPGSNGGMSNPVPSPQFGSVKKSVPEPTPAETRAQGG